MEERLINQVVGQVMVYDSTARQWHPAGTSSGLSTVRLIHCLSNNTFRIHGQKINELKEVVLDSQITREVKYNRANEAFIQWHDSQAFWGLNFRRGSPDAESFFASVVTVLKILNQNPNQQQQQQAVMSSEMTVNQQSQQQTQSTPNSAAIIQRSIQQQQHLHQPPQQQVSQQPLIHQQQMINQQQVQAAAMLSQGPTTQMIQQQQQQQMLHQQQLQHQHFVQQQQQQQQQVQQPQQQQQSLQSNNPQLNHYHQPNQQHLQQQQQTQQQQTQLPPQMGSMSAAPIPPPPPPPPPAPPAMLNNGRTNGTSNNAANSSVAPPPPQPTHNNNNANIQQSPSTINNNSNHVGSDMNGGSPSQVSSLASEIAKCQLKKVNLSRSDSEKETSECNNNNIGHSKTTRAASLALTGNLMNDLSKKLASRRERLDNQQGDNQTNSSSNITQTNGTTCNSQDKVQDSWLAEFIRKEIKEEIGKMKVEIIDAMKTIIERGR